MINPMGLPGASHLFKILSMIYQRLNALEKLLIPTVAAGYKPLFSDTVLGHPGFNFAVLGMIAITIAMHSLQVKRTSDHPATIFEPLLKASGWIFVFVEILQHIQHIPSVSIS